MRVICRCKGNFHAVNAGNMTGYKQDLVITTYSRKGEIDCEACSVVSNVYYSYPDLL